MRAHPLFFDIYPDCARGGPTAVAGAQESRVRGLAGALSPSANFLVLPACAKTAGTMVHLLAIETQQGATEIPRPFS
jgi:hypothetical protein